MKTKPMLVPCIAISFGLIDVVGLCGVRAMAGGPPAPVADPTGINKCRFISFSVPGGGDTALRVTLTSLHHVVPPYGAGPSIPFTAFEGQAVWVGPPTHYVESSANPIPFYASFLQCTPHYRDWSTVGLLHVTAAEIVPSSIYEVENLAEICMGVEGSCAQVSSPLQINTTRWGDVEVPFNPPSPSNQPDLNDQGALVAKFQGQVGAPIKARALLAGSDAFGNIPSAVIAADYSASHIFACTDAIQGLPYPYKPGVCGGAGGACIANSECT